MNDQIPTYLEERLKAELENRERVKWKEMPVAHFFSPSTISSFLFSIPWTVFAVFWMIDASESGNLAFTAFGIPFVLIGLGMLSTPIWTYRKSRNTLYAITDERALLFIGGRSITIKSFKPKDLQNVYRKEKKDGTGDVIITTLEWNNSDRGTQKEEIGFLRVKDPKKVELLLKRLSQPLN